MGHLAGLATKEDLKNCATKADIKAIEAELKNFATQKDVKLLGQHMTIRLGVMLSAVTALAIAAARFFL